MNKYLKLIKEERPDGFRGELIELRNTIDGIRT